MENVNDRKLELSVSTEYYKYKSLVKWGMVRYKRECLSSIDELAAKIRKGYCLCHCFNTEDEVFGIKQKVYANFEKADMVFVDIDNGPMPMSMFVERLSKKPTLCYTTPSNNPQEGIFRFRLVYVFDKPITSVEAYKSIYLSIMNKVADDVEEFDNKDDCGKSAVQQFGGNGKDDCEVETSDVVYCFDDFPCEINDVSPSSFLRFSNGKKKERKQPHTRPIEVNDERFMADFHTLKPYELIGKYSECYPIFDRTPLTFNEDGYALIPDDYREIYREWYLDPIDHKPRMKKLRDGDGRKKKLYLGGRIRREIKQDITYEHLPLNLCYDRLHFYDNSDKELSNDRLIQIANSVMTATTPLMLEQKHKQFTTDPKYAAEHGMTRNQLKNVVRKRLKDEAIGEIYDCGKSVSENLAMFKAMGFKVGKSKLYMWCKENGIATKPTAHVSKSQMYQNNL